ncbi:amino acid adenylation (plasmid) [Bacillus thuringiensis MC28]|nr:amino acid adenylation [Bacillus thuringiensis MC28]
MGGTFMKQFLKTKSSHVINDTQAPLTENRKILWLAHQIDEKSGLYYEPIFI